MSRNLLGINLFLLLIIFILNIQTTKCDFIPGNNSTPTSSGVVPIYSYSGLWEYLAPVKYRVFWIATIALIAVLGLIYKCFYGKCHSKRESVNIPQHVKQEPDQPIYSYVPIEMMSHYAARALVTGNKRLSPKSFVPALPPRPEGDYDYAYSHCRPTLVSQANNVRFCGKGKRIKVQGNDANKYANVKALRTVHLY